MGAGARPRACIHRPAGAGVGESAEVETEVATPLGSVTGILSQDRADSADDPSRPTPLHVSRPHS